MLNNQELTINEIQDAYNNLPENDRTALDVLVNDLIAVMKAKGREKTLRLFGEHRMIQFGPMQALELLAKVGVWLIYHPPIGEA
jgi:hypothetical protein